MDRIRYPFDHAKARAAAEFLLSLDGGRMDLLRLVKLLYLSEREALQRRGEPIFGGRFVSMDHGPVPSDALNMVRAASGARGSRLSQVHYSVVLDGEPDLGPLCEEDETILRAVSDRHEGISTWDLVELTHALPEWREPPKGSALPLDLADVLTILGRPQDVERLASTAEELTLLNKLGL